MNSNSFVVIRIATSYIETISSPTLLSKLMTFPSLTINMHLWLISIKNALASPFDNKDLGKPSQNLGVAFVRNRAAGTITLHQGNYIRKMLDKFGMSICKQVVCPDVTTSDNNDYPLLNADNQRRRLAQFTYRSSLVQTLLRLSLDCAGPFTALTTNERLCRTSLTTTMSSVSSRELLAWALL